MVYPSYFTVADIEEFEQEFAEWSLAQDQQ